MQRRLIGATLLAAGLSLPATFPALAAPAMPAVTEIELSHSFGRVNTEKLAQLAEQFNSRSKDAKVRLVSRADGAPPSVLNLATREDVHEFSLKKGQFRPLHQVMATAKEKFDAAMLAPELRVGVADAKGKLMALPVAMTTPVLFYNKTAFKKAGLNPDQPPRTWMQLQEAAGKLRDADISCPYTSSWPAWIHIDNLASLNSGDVADAKGRLAFNGYVQVKHVAMLATWHKSFYFIYFGRRNEADRHFAAGECGMLTSNVSLAAVLRDSPAIDFGVAPLPHHDDVRGAPDHTLADGASLWIGEGKKPAEYKAAAKFVSFLMTPEIQVEITKMGGYLPMTPVARAVADSKLLATDLVGLKTAYGQLKGQGAKHPVRVSQIEPVRAIVEEELEAVWANKKPAKEALDTAVARGNIALMPAPAAKSVAGKAKCGSNCRGS